MTSEQLSGAHIVETEDDLRKGDVGKKPSEVIAAGSALLYLRSYIQGEEKNHKAKMKLSVFQNYGWNRHLSMYAGITTEESEEQGKMANRKIFCYWYRGGVKWKHGKNCQDTEKWESGWKEKKNTDLLLRSSLEKQELVTQIRWWQRCEVDGRFQRCYSMVYINRYYKYLKKPNNSYSRILCM